MPVARVVLCVALALSVALLVKGWWGEPIAGVWFAGVLALLILVVLVGLRWPRLEMFGDLLWCGPSAGDDAVLTFDGLPHQELVEPLLRALEARQVCATFFVGCPAAGSRDEQRQTLRRLAAAGHRFGCWYRGKGRAEVAQLAAQLRECLAELRSIAETNDAVLDVVRPQRRRAVTVSSQACKRCGATLVGASWGWPAPNDASAAERDVSAGSLLCLATEGLSIETLTRTLDAGARNGVRWVCLSQWLS